METGERSRIFFMISSKDIIVMEFNLRRKHISRQLKSDKLFRDRVDKLRQVLQPENRLFANLLQNEVPASPKKS